MNYTTITYGDLYQKFLTLLASDDRFKNIGSASMFGMITEMLCASTDMELYSLQRILEECFFKTGMLDSTYIKLCKNMGYQPRRAIPAQATLKIVLKGPFPREILRLLENENHQHPIITIENEFVKLNFLGDDYLLEDKFTYEFTDDDIRDCVSSTWTKTFRSGKPREVNPKSGEVSKYRKLDKHDISMLNMINKSEESYVDIKCYQATEKYIVFKGEDFYNKFSTNENQYYDINDVSFSNWYSYRDPLAKNINGEYVPANSVTQVIVALDENEALNPVNNLYDYHSKKVFTIEDKSIFLNKKIIDSNGALPTKPHDICLISTNEDKTVRIEFSALDNITTNGVNYVNLPDGTTKLENVYVKYLSTTGAFANKINTSGSIMSHTNKFFITINGKAYDITNNIEFIITSDIKGGQNFEDKASMKDNANAYFASMMKLVSKNDFIKYFSTLKNPIKVNTALVFGESEITNKFDMMEYYKLNNIAEYRKIIQKNNSSDTNDNNILSSYDQYIKLITQNGVFYSLIGDLYKQKVNKYDYCYYPIYLFEEYKNHNKFLYDNTVVVEDDNDPSTLYGNNYYKHITDFVHYLVDQENVYNSEQLTTPTNESSIESRNIYEVSNEIKNIIVPNTILYSLPPFIHYFDIVGTVKVKALTKDLEQYQKDMRDKIYEFLNSNMNKNREVYKSDIVKLYYENENTAYVDIDIKTSNMLTPTSNSFEWSEKTANIFPYEYTNKIDTTYTYIPAAQGIRCVYDNSIDGNKNTNINSSIIKINEFFIPHHDKYFHNLNDYNNCNKKIANITLKFKNNIPITKQIICDISSTKNYIKISLIDDNSTSENSDYLISLPSPNFSEYLYSNIDNSPNNKIFNSNTTNTVIVDSKTIYDYDNPVQKIKTITTDYTIDVSDEIEEYSDDINNIELINLPIEYFKITFLSDDDYWSTSKLANTKTTNIDELIKDYGFDTEKLPNGSDMKSIKEEIISMVNSWISGMDIHDTANRAIALPYSVTSYQDITRLEEIARKGDIIKSVDNTLSEYSFWTYFVPALLETFYSQEDSAKYKDATADAKWEENKVKLIMDIYKLVKPGLNDSVLDDNNNVVNFSSDLEVAVLRNIVNVIYENE